MHEEARRLFQESLRIRRKTLGNQHPEVADSLNNLGELFLVEVRLRVLHKSHSTKTNLRGSWISRSHCWQKLWLFEGRYWENITLRLLKA